MAAAGATPGATSTLGLSDAHKRWLVFGIALNKILVPNLRPHVEQGVLHEYGKVTTSHNIHTQSTSGRLQKWPRFLKYENINNNAAHPKLRGGKWDYALFDCRVTSHVDFAKLYVENYMAKFSAFDEHCDASAVLLLLSGVPVFSPAVQTAAFDVRGRRNAWAHCDFSEWDAVVFQRSFQMMEHLVRALGLPSADEGKVLRELHDWKTTGVTLCMNSPVDPDLLRLVQQHVNALEVDLDKLAFELEEERSKVKKALQDTTTKLHELENRVVEVESQLEETQEKQKYMREQQKDIKEEQKDIKEQQKDMREQQKDIKEQQKYIKEEQKDIKEQQKDTREQQKDIKEQQKDIKEEMRRGQTNIQNRVAQVEETLSSVSFGNSCEVDRSPVSTGSGSTFCQSHVSVEIASCEADIAFFAKFLDSDTRQWLLDDFDRWFRDPGDSRAYVLLGDPGVGKSVVAAALAQHYKADLGAAYFCRHNDGTRRDPRYLLGTVAHQLCNCNPDYNCIVGGEGGIQKLLAERTLGVQELFTKLLEEPLSRCRPCQQTKLVIIDALDESEYESREDFLELIVHRFPMIPEWLVFFITSRPEDLVQFHLRKYNPCVKICAGDGDHHNFYQQHKQDIKKFLEKRIDISHLSCSVEDVAEKCNGLFLYAFYIVKQLESSVQSGRTFDHVNDLFPGDIDGFFLRNFKRVSEKVGEDVFKKLFGCAIVAPSPLPLWFISYFLKRENSVVDEQEVVDAVSLFMVSRTSDQTFCFLHNLIPAWLTDKNKASRRLVIDKKIAGEYLRDVFDEILSAIVSKPSSSVEVDLQDYVIRFGVRYLCQIFAGYDSGKGSYLNTVFECLSNYRFIEKRLERRRIELFTLLEDYRLAANRFAGMDSGKEDILREVYHLLDDNAWILSECPHLLHSCLRNAPKVVRDNIVIPAEVSAPWLDANTSNSQYPTAKVPSVGEGCFAVSPDESLFVEGNDCCISFFDAVSLENVLGPFDLRSSVNRICVGRLEFSADGKFVFFGRLDKWFSVERRRVEEFTQFSGNSYLYRWAYFTRDRQWVAVKREDFHSIGRFCVQQVCLAFLFTLWTAREVDHIQGQMICSLDMDLLMEEDRKRERMDMALLMEEGRKRECIGSGVLLRALDIFTHGCKHDGSGGTRKADADNDVFGIVKSFSFPSNGCVCCRIIRELQQKVEETSLTTLRQHIIDLYRDIFQHQVWDINSGKPVLEQVFSSGGQMSPFTYWCHLTTALENCGRLFSGVHKAMCLPNVALINAVYYCIYRPPLSRFRSMADVLDSRSRVLLGGAFDSGSRNFTSAPLELENPCNVMHEPGLLSRLQTLSPERKWIACRDEREWTTVCIFEKPSVVTGKPTYVIKNVKSFVFANENAIVYIRVTFRHHSLRAVSLLTGKPLTSVSGLNPVHIKRFGFLFRNDDEETFIPLTNTFRLPGMFFPFLSAKQPCRVAFNGAGLIMSVRSTVTAVVTLWRTDDHDAVVFVPESILVTPERMKGFHVRKCAFSPDGTLLAIHHDTEVSLFITGDRTRFLCTVFQAENEFTAVWLAFSADSSLLLFCIQETREGQHFCVWDVQKQTISGFLDCPSLSYVESCCFSSDNKDLILCGEYEIKIVTNAPQQRYPLTTAFVTERPYINVKFSHCTVSSDDKLLACCLADTILLYSPRQSYYEWREKRLLGHSGRIEFCQFLKGSRFLISYGIDGCVFLWDLRVFEAVAHTKIAHGREYIVSMAVALKEDIAVCFMSSGRFVTITLRELEKEVSLNFLRDSDKSKTGRKVVEKIHSESTSRLDPVYFEEDISELLSYGDAEEELHYSSEDDSDDDDE